MDGQGSSSSGPQAKKIKLDDVTAAMEGLTLHEKYMADLKLQINELTEKIIQAKKNGDTIAAEVYEKKQENLEAELKSLRDKLTMKPSNDAGGTWHPPASLSKYWRDALAGEIPLIAGGSVDIPEHLCRPEAGKVLVRDAYVQLAEKIMKELNHQQIPNRSGPFGNIAVYGTPGVGKSVFASLMIAWLAKSSPKPPTVFYTANASRAHGMYMGFFPDGSIRLLSPDEMSRELDRVQRDTYPSAQQPARADSDRDLVWTIVDGYNPPKWITTGRYFRNILVSSSNLESPTGGWLRQLDKDMHYRLLAPPASLDEMVIMDTLTTGWSQGNGAARLKTRYETFGGIPRLVLGAIPEPEECLATIIRRGPGILLRALRDTNEGSETEACDSSRLIHLHPPKPGMADFGDEDDIYYGNRVPSFASTAVVDAVMDHLNDSTRAEALNELSRDITRGFGMTVAVLFEPFMHRFICQGKQFVLDGTNAAPRRGATASRRPVDGQKKRLVDPPPMKNKVLFDSDLRLCDAPIGVYMVPKSKSYASIDSFIRCQDGRTLLFQMTGQESHPINMPDIMKLFRVDPNTTPGCKEVKEHGSSSYHIFVPDKTELIFVVTPNRKDFKIPQPFVSKSGGAALACNNDPEKYIKDMMRQGKVTPADIRA